MKYFVLGAFSSAFFLYGIALVYGATGSTNLGRRSPSFLSDRPCSSTTALLLAGLALLLVGFGFKVAAVPFHTWTPDVYQGAPTPGRRLHGLRREGRRLRRPAAGLRPRLRHLPARLAADRLRPGRRSRMVVGAVLAVVQTDVKRMLAYSSISHAGFILVGVQAGHRAGARRRRSSTWSPTRSWSPAASASSPSSAARATIGHSLDDYRGLSATGPLLAFAFTLFLLAQAGVPLTVGLLRQVLRDRRRRRRRLATRWPSSPCSPR